MNGPLIKDRPTAIAEFVISIQQSTKKSIILMCPTLDEASYDDFLNDALKKYGYNPDVVSKKIADILPINTHEKFGEFIQLTAHEVMMYSYFAFENIPNLESDYAWLCLCMANQAEAKLQGILFSNFSLHAFTKGLKSDSGRRNAAKSHSPKAMVKIYFLAKVVKFCRNGKRWDNWKQAVDTLRQPSFRYAKRCGTGFSAMQFATTSRGWIKKMDHVDDYFINAK